MKKTGKLERALKDNFNAEPEIAISSTWQTDLLERLYQIKPFQALQAKFERNIWRLTWITFTVSATAAVIMGVYFYNNHIDSESDNNIYTNLAMLD
jgi:hypothetical protein